MTVTFPQGVLGVVPAFQLRNLQVYMYYPPPSPTLHGTVTSTLADLTPRKDGVRPC